MSDHLNIVRENPQRDIPRAEWLAFLHGTPELISEEGPNPTSCAYLVSGPRNVRFYWVNGCIVTSDASRELANFAFACARQLDATVVGPRGAVYTSPDDWERKTRESRAQHASRVEQNCKNKSRDRTKVLLKIIAGLILGYVAYELIAMLR